jgi:hypothetical protein
MSHYPLDACPTFSLFASYIPTLDVLLKISPGKCRGREGIEVLRARVEGSRCKPKFPLICPEML